MSRLLVPLLLVATVAGAGYFAWTRNQNRTGYPAPDFELSDLNGRTHRLSEYRGQVVFLNLWATWCPPCREEIPSMDRLYRRFSSQGLVMLAVSEDTSPPETIAAFAREIGATFPILHDSQGRLPTVYGVTGYPETFIIDRAGNIIQHIVGPEDWDSAAATDYFTKLLARPETTAAQ